MRRLFFAVALLFAAVAGQAQGDECDLQHTQCDQDCADFGYPRGCLQTCSRAYLTCESRNVCTPFCPP